MNKKITMLVCLLSGISFMSMRGMDITDVRRAFVKPRVGVELRQGELEWSVAAMFEENILDLNDDDDKFQEFLDELTVHLQENKIYVQESGPYLGNGKASVSLFSFCHVTLRERILQEKSGMVAKKIDRLNRALTILSVCGLDEKRPRTNDALAPSAEAFSRAGTPKNVGNDDSVEELLPSPSRRGPRSRKPLFLGLAAAAGMGLLFWKWYTTEEKKA